MDLSQKIASDVVIYSKYARYIPELKRRETWDEIVDRYQAMMVKKYPQLDTEIVDACGYVRRKEVLPSMRMLQFAGPAIERNNSRGYNCSAMAASYPSFFKEVMFLLLGGTGVGYSVQRSHTDQLPMLQAPKRPRRWLVGDSIEGWADSVHGIMRSFFEGKPLPKFDYSDIRRKGEILKTAGGRAPGSNPLRICHDRILGLLENKEIGTRLEPWEVSDICCYIADAVLSGGIRRAAMIALFDIDDQHMLHYKSGSWWELHSERGRVNVSAIAYRPTVSENDFKELMQATIDSKAGEPGIFWTNDLEQGTNPCCFSGDALLMTEHGEFAIKNLVGDLNLVTSTGKTVGGRVWSNGLKEVVEIKFPSKKKIKCTPDHVFMLNDGSFAPASSLKNKRLMPFFRMNEVVTEFTKYGFIQGDGVTGRLTSKDHLGMEVNIGSNDDDIAELFGVERKPNKRAFYLTGFKEKLVSLGFSSEELPNRILPSSYFAWDKDQKKAFLCGLFSANGSVINDQRIAFKSTCFALITQMMGALAEFEIMSYVTTNKAKEVKFSNGTYLCKESYDLNISQIESIKRFSSEICFVHKYKREALKKLIVARGSFVQSVKKTSPEEVFDFALFDENHWGIINGNIVHNCEIALRHKEFCNLTTINLSNVKDYQDFIFRTRIAALLGTLQAGFADFHYLSQEWEDNCKEEALLGISITGIGDRGDYASFNFKSAADAAKGANAYYAEAIHINRAARITCIKPEGTASLVLGTSSGVHGRHAPYYIRRFRFKRTEPIAVYFASKLPMLVVDDLADPDGIILELPQKSPIGSIMRDESASSLLNRAKFFHENWIEPGHVSGPNKHNVSVTVSVKDEEWDSVGEWMWENRESYNGISVLPFDGGSYQQAPFETCTKEKYEEMFKLLEEVDLSEVNEDFDGTARQLEAACSGGKCDL